MKELLLIFFFFISTAPAYDELIMQPTGRESL